MFERELFFYKNILVSHLDPWYPCEPWIMYKFVKLNYNKLCIKFLALRKKIKFITLHITTNALFFYIIAEPQAFWIEVF